MNGFIFSTMAAAVAFLAACAAAPPPASVETPLQMTISEILKDPWRYDGKLVRVRGTFDECISLTCRFCETAQAPSRGDEDNDACMGVSFESRAQLEPTGSEEHASRMQGWAENLLEKFARFTTATLEARYDAACSQAQKPGETGDLTICTDRASQLRNARFVRVHVRRPATAGHFNMYRRGLVKPANSDEAKKIQTAFKEAASAFAPVEELVPDYVYVLKNEVNWLREFGVEAAGGACLCLLDDCSKVQWPKRFGDATFDIPANPYKCWWAERRNGVWRFPLQ